MVKALSFPYHLPLRMDIISIMKEIINNTLNTRLEAGISGGCITSILSPISNYLYQLMIPNPAIF